MIFRIFLKGFELRLCHETSECRRIVRSADILRNNLKFINLHSLKKKKLNKKSDQ